VSRGSVVENVRQLLSRVDSRQPVTEWAEEDTAGISSSEDNWEDLVFAVVKSRVRELATAL
jgi:hypothetical protein